MSWMRPCVSGHPSPPVVLHQMSSGGFSRDRIGGLSRREILPVTEGLGEGQSRVEAVTPLTHRPQVHLWGMRYKLRKSGVIAGAITHHGNPLAVSASLTQLPCGKEGKLHSFSRNKEASLLTLLLPPTLFWIPASAWLY